jgi:mandelamide amidase
MRTGQIKAEAYAAALLARCELLSELNAFISIDRELVLESARAADRRRAEGSKLGLMHGLPVAVKDSINTKDLETTAGTKSLRSFKPKQDAPVMTALYGAGAILLGKTNLHELSYGWTSNNYYTGPVHNPYDPTRIPGGSTGGTAAAVASRMVSSGLAEDTNGSIRVPAALCGIAGLRPSTGRWPAEGVVPITGRFDTVGPHARTVADLILYDSVVTGDASRVDPGDLRGVRLAVSSEYFLSGIDDEVERVFRDALRRLQAGGATLVWADVPNLGPLIDAVNFPIQQHEAIASLERYLADNQTGLTADQVYAEASPDIKWVVDTFFRSSGKFHFPDEVYRAAIEVNRPALRQSLNQYFGQQQVAAIVFPTTMCAASRIGEDVEVEINGQKVPVYIAYARNISLGNSAGLPGLVLPAGVTSIGLPLGIEFDGPTGTDRELLRLGLSLEKALGPILPPKV